MRSRSSGSVAARSYREGSPEDVAKVTTRKKTSPKKGGIAKQKVTDEEDVLKEESPEEDSDSK